jgi:hypothetical protein
MRINSTLVGLLALGFVAAGVLYVRFRPPTVGQAPFGTGSPAASARSTSDDESLPDVTLAEGTADLGDVRLTLSVLPNPPVAFATFQVRVTALGPDPTAASPDGSGGKWPLAIKGGLVAFEMTMPMGEHRYSLMPAGRGGYGADVVLPLCPSGKRRWYATVEGTIAGRAVTARFRLDLAPPPSVP